MPKFLIAEKPINLNNHLNRSDQKIISINCKNPVRKLNILCKTPNKVTIKHQLKPIPGKMLKGKHWNQGACLLGRSFNFLSVGF